MGKNTENEIKCNQKRVCPFRINVQIQHALYKGTTEPVVAGEEYVFADCYKEACPYWAWEVNKGFICKKIGGSGNE